MAQIFHPSTNTLSRLSLYGAVFIAALAGYAVYRVNQPAYLTDVNVALQQPVPRVAPTSPFMSATLKKPGQAMDRTR